MMNNYSTVKGLLESLNVTEEELEMHKELIEECRENEQKIIEYSFSTKQNIEKISVVLSGLSQVMMALMETLDYSITDMERITLKMMPADMFYHE